MKRLLVGLAAVAVVVLAPVAATPSYAFNSGEPGGSD